MFRKKIIFCLVLQLVLSSLAYAEKIKPALFKRPFYIGALAGYGTTTWQGLVPAMENQNQALNLSTPIRVEEGGGVYGLLLGYEFSPYFALEGGYTNYPKAKVYFDEFSLFAFDHDDLREFRTKTDVYTLQAKVMLLFPQTALRFYSSLGLANMHRIDLVNNHSRLSPTFGAGFNYRMNEHLMTELGGSYIAGYGESQLSPIKAYFPFLYSVSFRVAYFF